MKNQILFVDDDPSLLAIFQEALHHEFGVDIAIGGAAGLELIKRQGPYAVVVADMQMPKMNGISFLAAVEDSSPDTVRLMLTGNSDQKTARDALNQGHIFRFINKPCSGEDLAQHLRAALEYHRGAAAERQLLEQTLNGSVKMLTDLLALLDPISFGRAQRMRDYVRKFAPIFPRIPAWELELAAMLAPIGFVTIPVAVTERLHAGRSLTAAERDMLSRVPRVGSQLLSNIPRLESVANIVLYQNKHFDGAGCPLDLSGGEQIPLGARILNILGDLVALETQGTPRFSALERMLQLSGKYDPKVLALIANGFDFNTNPQCPPETFYREILFKDLVAGAILTADVLTSEGTLIVTAGAEVSQTLLEKLRNFSQFGGIQEPICVRS